MNSYKKILNIALPAMGENFLQMLMGMVDSYLVAHLGLIAISGVSVAGNIITIYQAIFLALGAAVASVMSKSLGEKNQENIAYHATESLKVTLLLSALLGGASLLFGRQMISLLGTEAAVAESGGIYLSLVGGTIVLLGLMTTFGSGGQQSTSSYVCEPVDQSIKRSILLCGHFPFWLGHCRSGFGDCAGPSGGRHPLVAKGPATLCPPWLGIGS